MADPIEMKKPLPLVSIICTAYNHADFIWEALESIYHQHYPATELILIDNGSEDETVKVIGKWFEERKPEFAVKKIFHIQSLPYCQAFNLGLFQSNGKYIIDFSGDDLMCNDHIFKSVKRLESEPEAAFCFSDALMFDGSGIKSTFYKRNQHGELAEHIPEGDRYLDVVSSHCISSVTLVFRADFLKAVGGYDEKLMYEDFDIMVRLTRSFPVVFSDHLGVQKRVHQNSFSSAQYKPATSTMLPSTLRICKKIKGMNQYPEEDAALLKRVMFETKHSLWSANFSVAKEFLELADQLQGKGIKLWVYKIWVKTRLDLSKFYLMLKKP